MQNKGNELDHASHEGNSISYEVPILSLKEVLDAFNTFQIPIEDMSKPSENYVRRVYSKFMELLLGIYLENFSSVKSTSYESSLFENPEFHEFSLGELEFRKHLYYLMSSIGVSNFSVFADVIIPDAKRFRQIVSSLINFARFRQKRIDLYEELRKESEKLLSKKEKLVQLQEDTLNQLQELKLKEETQRDELRSLEKLTEEMARQIQRLNAQQLELQSSNKELKRKCTEVAARIQSDSVTLEQTKEMCSTLRPQIIQNPALLKKKITDLAESVTDLTTSINDHEANIRLLHTKIAQQEQQSKDVEQCIIMANENKAELDNNKKIQESIKAALLKVDKLKEEKEDLLLAESHLKRHLSVQMEKLERLRKQQEEKRQAREEGLQDSLREKQLLMKNRDEQKGKLDQNREAIQELHRAIEKLTEDHDMTVASLENEIGSLDNVLKSYHKTLLLKVQN